MKKFFVGTLFLLSVITIFSIPLDEFVFENFNEAFEVAELTNKRVVVMFSTPTCPVCTQFKETTLLDEEISLDKFIADGLGKDIDVLPKTVYLSKDEIERLLVLDTNTKVYEPGKNYDPYTNIVLLQNNTNEQNLENFYVKIFESKN